MIGVMWKMSCICVTIVLVAKGMQTIFEIGQTKSWPGLAKPWVPGGSCKGAKSFLAVVVLTFFDNLAGHRHFFLIAGYGRVLKPCINNKKENK